MVSICLEKILDLGGNFGIHEEIFTDLESKKKLLNFNLICGGISSDFRGIYA